MSNLCKLVLTYVNAITESTRDIFPFHQIRKMSYYYNYVKALGDREIDIAILKLSIFV